MTKRKPDDSAAAGKAGSKAGNDDVRAEVVDQDSLIGDDWERQVDAATEARQNKIQKLRIAEAGSGEYDDERKKWHPFLAFLGWMGLIGLLTAAGAGAGWYFWLRHVEADKPKTSQQTTPPAASKPAEEPTETYNSVAFGLQFDYPQKWKVTETDTNKLTITSTPLGVKAVSVDGDIKKVSARAVVTMQHKQSGIPEFESGNAQAVRESELMNYAKPSQMQRGATYLSFLNYAGSQDAGRKGIDAVYVSGDNGYVKDQYVEQSGVINGDPLITVTFQSCPDTKCEKPGPALTVIPSMWDDKDFVKPIRSTLESIVVL